MGYEIAAWMHAFALDRRDRFERSSERGQGTVEYVGVVVMVTLLIGALATAAKTGWSGDIGDALKGTLEKAVKKASGGL
jgi:hypothetical protein